MYVRQHCPPFYLPPELPPEPPALPAAFQSALRGGVVFQGASSPMTAEVGMHPAMSGWAEEAFEPQFVLPASQRLENKGTAVWCDPRDAVVQALFHPWSLAREDRSYAITRFPDPYYGGSRWLVTKNAYEAATEGYVSSLEFEGMATVCSSSVPSGQLGDVRIMSYEDPFSLTRVTREDLPDMCVADIDPTLPREELRQALAATAGELAMGRIVPHVAFMRSKGESSTTRELLAQRAPHRPLRYDPPNRLPLVGLEYMSSPVDAALLKVRKAEADRGDDKIGLAVRMLTYVSTYGEFMGDEAAAAEFVCTHKVNGREFWRRMGGYLQGTIGQANSYHSVTEFYRYKDRHHPVAIGELAFRGSEVLLSAIYSLAQGQGVGTKMMDDFDENPLRDFEGVDHLIVARDPRIKEEEFSAAERFYLSHGFRRWPKPVSGPIWPNGKEMGQWCMTRNRKDPNFFMPADQTPPLSWDSDNGRLVHIPLAIS